MSARVPGADTRLPLGATGGRLARSDASSPQTDGRPESPAGPAHGTLTVAKGSPSDLPGAWPRFRGPNADGVSAEATRLLAEWGPEGPPLVWSIQVGEGHAGAAVRNGRVYLLDYDVETRGDALRCLSLATGEEIWRYSYPVHVASQHGRSRTVPAVTDTHVVAIGPKCHVTCVDAVAGTYRWGIDLVKEYGSAVPLWYAAQCPLIDGTRAIIAPAGKKVLMMAVECSTGDVVWKTPNTHSWEMTHISITPMTFKGRRMYIYGGMRGAAGISAEDGSVLWEYHDWKARTAWVASPVVVGEDRILLSSGYNIGCTMLRLAEAAGLIVVERVFQLRPKVFGAEQHTPIYYHGYIYGVRPDGELVCLDPDGNVKWTSGSEHRFFKGYGPWLIAGGMIFVIDPGSTLEPNGSLALVEASPAGCHVLAQAKVLDGHDAWGPMAIADGRLIVRDASVMKCFDVAAR